MSSRVYINYLKRVFRLVGSYRSFTFVVLSLITSIVLEVVNLQKASATVLIICSVVISIKLGWDMIQKLRDGLYGVDVLAIMAIVASILLKEYWAAGVILLMATGGGALELYAMRRAKRDLDNLLKTNPTVAHVYRGRKIIDVKVNEVREGDILVIEPGEIVPVDCQVNEGTSVIDQSAITGESAPIDVASGSALYSGTRNINGSLTVKALRTSDQSQYQQIVKMVSTAASSQSPFVRLADRYSIPFTLLALGIAGGAWYFSGDPSRFLQVLVVATPCPLLLAPPIAIISGIGRAAKRGIIIKSGTSLEQLATVKSIAFDKTGTLTEGKNTLLAIKPYGAYTEDEVLNIAASIQQHSNHLFAKAITHAAHKRSLKLKKSKQIKETAGYGVVGTAGGHQIYIGSLHFMQRQNIEVKNPISSSNSVVYIAQDSVLIGIIELSDSIREESKETIHRLRKMGIKHILMVTGDNSLVAKVIAKSLGIRSYFADCLPGDKIRTLENYAHKPIAFVGDGVNDAPALVAADVGIAIRGEGDSIASDSADIVLTNNSLALVADGVSISRRSLSIAGQSIIIGIVLSVVLMLVFSTGKFRAIYGAGLQELIDIAVILNALRARGGKIS